MSLLEIFGAWGPRSLDLGNGARPEHAQTERAGSLDSNSFQRTKRRDPKGFSLLEVLVAATLLAVAVIATGYLFVAGQGGMEQEEWLRAALQKAQQKLEELRGLPLTDASLLGEPEPGKEHLDSSNPVILEQRDTVEPSDDLKGYLRWKVVLVDDPINGPGEDYLLVRVEVSQDSDFSPSSPHVALETFLAR